MKKAPTRTAYPKSDMGPGWEINESLCVCYVKKILLKAKAGKPVSHLEFQFCRLIDDRLPVVYRLTHEEVFGKIPRTRK